MVTSQKDKNYYPELLCLFYVRTADTMTGFDQFSEGAWCCISVIFFHKYPVNYIQGQRFQYQLFDTYGARNFGPRFRITALKWLRKGKYERIDIFLLDVNYKYI